MKRELLLKEIAETGYNVLYAAKKHFATYDIVEKAPGWITISTLSIGIFALVIPALTNAILAAAILTVGIASIYFNQFQDQRGRYSEVGGKLISQFNKLRALYHEAKSRSDTDSVEDLEQQYRVILAESEQVMLHKHIFLSDWYAHYKIFWQAQIGWLDDQLHFKFWRDKIPLTLTVTFIVVVIGVIYLKVDHYIDVCGVIK